MDLTWSRAEVSLFDASGENLPCVGTILSSYLILTVASCLYGNGKGRDGMTIRTKSGRGQQSNSNTNSKLEEEQIRNIGQTLFHPDFENSTQENDVAILVLDEQLNLTLDGAKTMATGFVNEPTSTSTNFMGRLCREDSEFSPLLTTKCPKCHFAPKSDKLCLLPAASKSRVNSKERNSRAGNWNCSVALPGSSLICSDDKESQFLCGILSSSPQNPDAEDGNGKIYTSISNHLKWIQSVSHKIQQSKTGNNEEIEMEVSGSLDLSHDLDEDLEARFPGFENGTRKKRSSQVREEPCGRYKKLWAGDDKIEYKVPEHLRGRKLVCVWVVAAAYDTKIEYYVLSNARADFQPGQSNLYIIYNFKKDGFSHLNMLTKDRRYILDQPYFLLYFRTSSSASNSGFRIHLKGAGELEEQKTVVYTQRTGISTSEQESFKFPASGAEYSNDNRIFVLIKPSTPRGKMQMELYKVDTEENYDWLDVLSVRSLPTSLFRYSGHFSFWWFLFRDNTRTTDEGEPLILYFHSDSSVTKSGFEFSCRELTA